MKNSILLTASLFLFSFNIFAQAPAIQWQKAFGGFQVEAAQSVQQTADGGYIMAGYTQSNPPGDVSGNHGQNDYWVVKTDAAGNITWQKALGGTSSEQARSIRQTADGGYIVAGFADSNNGDVSGNHGNSDYWVVKLTAAGNLTWQKSLGGTGFDNATSIQQTADGGYIVAGYTTSNNGDVSGNHDAGRDYWVVKLDAAGNLTWQKCLGSAFGAGDFAFSVQQTTDGGYIVAGRSSAPNGFGDVTANHGGYDYWVVKLNAAGNLTWQKSLGGTSQDEAWSIQQTADGGYIVAGSTFSNNGDVTGNHGNIDYWVVKLDASGNLTWQKALGGTLEDVAFSVQQTTDGGYIVAGWTFSNDGDVSGNHSTASPDFWVVKLNAAGNLTWQKAMGGTGGEQAQSVQQTIDGGYIVAGNAVSNNGDVSGVHGNDYDFWLVKLEPEVTAAPIPTLSEWGLILFGLLLLCTGAVAVWRSRYAVVRAKA